MDDDVLSETTLQFIEHPNQILISYNIKVYHFSTLIEDILYNAEQNDRAAFKVLENANAVLFISNFEGYPLLEDIKRITSEY